MLFLIIVYILHFFFWIKASLILYSIDTKCIHLHASFYLMITLVSWWVLKLIYFYTFLSLQGFVVTSSARFTRLSSWERG